MDRAPTWMLLLFVFIGILILIGVPVALSLMSGADWVQVLVFTIIWWLLCLLVGVALGG